MNVLIVYAHPEPRSFNGAMKDAAVEVLRSGGHAVEVSDLYAMKFEASGGPHDFLALRNAGFFRYQLEQKHAAESDGFVPQLAEEMDKVVRADLLILQFPLWWFSLPAILKGWIDRVLAMGFAYEIGRSHEEGPLAGRRSMLALTTGGPPPAYGHGGVNGDIDRLLFHIQYGMLHFVGMDVLPPFVAYGAARCSDEERAAYLEAYRRRLADLESERPLVFDVEKQTSAVP